MNETHWILSLSVPPSLEESVVDWLLSLDPHLRFTSFPVSGHSSDTGDLSVAEQVSGRKREVRFEVDLPEPKLAPVLGRLGVDFKSTGIAFWVTPIADRGSV